MTSTAAAGQGELALGGLPAPLFGATPTRLTTWLDCPRRYRFTYLDRPPPPKGPPWAHNSLGASVHLALAGFWTARLPRPRTAAAAGRLLETGLARATASATTSSQPRGGRGPGDGRAVRRNGSTRATSRSASSGRSRRRPTCSRCPAGSTGSTTGVPADGRRSSWSSTTRPAGTSSRRSDARSSTGAGPLRARGARALPQAVLRVELHHLPTGEVARPRAHDESLARHLARAESIAPRPARPTPPTGPPGPMVASTGVPWTRRSPHGPRRRAGGATSCGSARRGRRSTGPRGRGTPWRGRPLGVLIGEVGQPGDGRGLPIAVWGRWWL